MSFPLIFLHPIYLLTQPANFAMLSTGVRHGATRKRFMMSAIKCRLLFLPILFGSLSFGFAQPSGAVTFSFDRSSFPVWDFSGAYQLDQQVVGAGGALLDLSYGVEIVQDLSGRLTGSGVTLVAIGTDFVAANYSLRGNVSLGGNDTRAVFSVRLAGQDVIAGQTRSFNIQLSYNLVVDPNPANPPAWIPPLHGSPVRGSLRIQGFGSATVVSGDGFSIPLPTGVDGGWTLTMEILALNRLGGVAAVAIDRVAGPGQAAGYPTTRNLSFNLTGSYHLNSGLSQLHLLALPGSQGNSLQVYLYDGAAVPSRLIGKLLGQIVRQ